MKNKNRKIIKQKGSSLIDIIIGTAIMVIVFIGIFSVFKLSIELVSSSKAKVGALALANEQLEFLRSLSYDDVGTIGGIPSGNIPQEEIIVLNQTTYTRRTFVQYVDDPKDGLGIDDENNIMADYKTVKVEMKWLSREREKKFSLVSNIVPKGIETLEGGGVLTINVIDAFGAPVVGVMVNIKNDNTNPTIDTTTFTGISGKVSFPGVPESSGYEIIVEKSGYSAAKTYDSDINNPNPNPGHLTVVEGGVTSASFAIDLLSSKTIKTWEPIKEKNFEDLFVNSNNISSTSNTVISEEAIKLFEDVEVGYSQNGFVFSTTIAPQYLAKWKSVSFNDNEPIDTNISYKIYFIDENELVSIIPNGDLFGNEQGFENSPINISGLDINMYPKIQIAGFISTQDASSTPSILDWKIIYDNGPVPIGNIPFSMRGDKTIGTDNVGAPIYKYLSSHQTNSNGEISLNNLEWDNYIISIDDEIIGYDISESCFPQPRSISPNTLINTDIFLLPNTEHSLLVAITNDLGELLEDAEVRLYRDGYDDTKNTSSCGQIFWENLSKGIILNENSYNIDVSLGGYENTTITDVNVDGVSQITILLNQL